MQVRLTTAEARIAREKRLAELETLAGVDVEALCPGRADTEFLSVAEINLTKASWLARIFQHEVDHVNGVIFTQRAERVWKPETEEEENDKV